MLALRGRPVSTQAVARSLPGWRGQGTARLLPAPSACSRTLRLSAASAASALAFAAFRRRSAAARFATSAEAQVESAAELQAFIDDVNLAYELVHRSFEEQFWGTKMALRGNSYSIENLAATKGKMEAFLADPELLRKTRGWLASGVANEEQLKILKVFERTFQCYIMESPSAKSLREECTQIEGKLGAARNSMKLGAEIPAEGFVELSSVGLRNKMRIDDDEAVRRACFEGLDSIGPFVFDNGFVELVKKRNRMAKELGYVDFYDYKVVQAEGFDKARLFEILDTLERGTRDLLARAKEALVEEKGVDALKPWNMEYMLAGDLSKKMDPYFPFEMAVENWARSYAALGIGYRGATMTLDLLDRKGKYSNGFCHWTQPPWIRPDGSWQPSHANFTSLADPKQIGSGLTALTTLMHEAGHAAHMANIVQPSPLFAQERAPMSVAYAENQSMFLDSLVNDAAWRGRYARDRLGNVIPWEILEEDLRSRHPYAVFALRRMLSVPFFEKALYELPEEEMTASRIAELASETEHRIGGTQGPLPLMAIPHILSDEASCYYHGYVLAEMAVHQTRAYFQETDGFIVDNPKVGPTLAEKYWRPGNSASFLDLVAGLTGKPLTGDAWVRKLERPLEELVASEKLDYEQAVSSNMTVADDLDLGMHVQLVDGDDVIADSSELGSFLAASGIFSEHVKMRVSS